LVTATASAALMLAILGMALRARRQRQVAGDAGLVGSVTQVEALGHNPHHGWISLQGERWQVDSREPLQVGQRVQVEAREGLRLRVALVLSAFRILREYVRGVVFQLGRLWKVKGPGLILVIPGLQQMVRVDLRTLVLDVPTQDVISRDNVSVKVNAVIYYRVLD